MAITLRKCSIAAIRIEIILEENKKIAYCLGMEYLYQNQNLMDCAVVAIYNALIAGGKPQPFAKVKRTCIKKGWYDENEGFYNKHVIDAILHFGVEARFVGNFDTKELYRRVKEEKFSYLLMCNTNTGSSYFDTLPGHCMVIIKGKIGAEVVNTYTFATGWRTLSRNIKQGRFVAHAIEIKKAA